MKRRKLNGLQLLIFSSITLFIISLSAVKGFFYENIYATFISIIFIPIFVFIFWIGFEMLLR